MTNDKEKEEALDKRKELREKFNEWIDGYDILHGVKMSVGSRDYFFNWLTQEIDAKEKIADHEISYNNKLLDKISHLESIIQAAKGIVKFYEAGDDSELELCIRDFKALQNPLSGKIEINDSNRDTFKVGYSGTTPLLDKEEPHKPEKDVSKGAETAGEVLSRITGKSIYTLGKYTTLVTLTSHEALKAMQEYSQAQRLQARNLVFENNKPVSDHVNETFEGLNSLTDDTEVVWWYKELIVQTVLHFTLQEREKAIDEAIKCIRENFQFMGGNVTKAEVIEELEALKNNP